MIKLFGPKGGTLVWTPGSKDIDPQKCPLCMGRFKNRVFATVHLIKLHPEVCWITFQLFSLDNKTVENGKA